MEWLATAPSAATRHQPTTTRGSPLALSLLAARHTHTPTARRGSLMGSLSHSQTQCHRHTTPEKAGSWSHTHTRSVALRVVLKV